MNNAQFNAADSLPSQTTHSCINIRHKHRGIQTELSAMTTIGLLMEVTIQ